MDNIKTYEGFLDSLFKGEDDIIVEQILKMIDHYEVDEVGGGRAPFTRRNYFVFLVKFINQVKLRVQTNMDGKDIRVTQNDKLLDLSSSVKKKLLKKVKELAK